MGLLRNGLRLSKEAYSQGTIVLRDSRRGLAQRLWEAGIGAVDARWHPHQEGGNSEGAVNSEQPNRGRGARTHKRKRSNEGRILQGSNRMRTVFGCYERVRKRKEDRRCSKRSARLEAKEEGAGKTDVRIYQPPVKKAKEDTASH